MHDMNNTLWNPSLLWTPLGHFRGSLFVYYYHFWDSRKCPDYKGVLTCDYRGSTVLHSCLLNCFLLY